MHYKLKIISPEKIAVRSVEGQVQLKLQMNKFQLPSQVDAIYELDNGILTIHFVNDGIFLCKVKIEISRVDLNSHIDVVPALSKQKMARFEFITSDDEFAVVVMNSLCFKRL